MNKIKIKHLTIIVSQIITYKLKTFQLVTFLRVYTERTTFVYTIGFVKYHQNCMFLHTILYTFCCTFEHFLFSQNKKVLFACYEIWLRFV